MFHRSTRLTGCLLFLALLAVSGSVWADGGKELFEQQCSGCHTIGGGDGAGPDLKGITAKRPADWLVKVIVEPDKLTAAKDPTHLELTKKYGMEMPNLGVSREDARKILAFLGGGRPAAAKGETSGAKGKSAEAKGAAKPADAAAPAPGAADAGAAAADAGAAAAGLGQADTAEAAKPAEVVVTPELVAKGVALFTGKERFANGGAPCVSCHALHYRGINGGALAADLTPLYGKMGEAGVRGVLTGLKFPVMKKIYAERPLTDEEKTALVALFKDAAAKKEPASDPYPVAGLAFFGVCLAALVLFKRRIG